jgi:hypothetical protein
MHRSVPELVAALEQANWRCLTICDSRETGDQPSILDEMIRGTKVLHRESKGRIAWATTFDPRPFESPGFTDRVTTALNATSRRTRSPSRSGRPLVWQCDRSRDSS